MHLARATLLAHASRDPLVERIREAERLAVRLRDLAQQRAYHRNAYELADRAMHEAQGELQSLFQPATTTTASPAQGGWWQRLLSVASFRSHAPAHGIESRETFRVHLADLPSRSAVDANAQPRLALTVHTLGGLHIMVNGQPIERCVSSRGRAVFTYLLAHRSQTVSRDVLMDVFWPDAPPAAARNNLNVALHSLRRVFKEISVAPVIVFQEGAYGLNPELDVWLDVEAFVMHADLGYKRQAEGDVDAAILEYEAAASLYGGDFLADSPYEEWTTLPRERLRLAYLDILDRLSCIHLSREQFAACAALCQLILARDACREDIHCRLMRCYARQNQYPSAMRQYQACVEALRTELGVEPSEATVALVERLRRHEAV
ncbi:MAG: winged helix-turn-helix domain-containing protein [Anaerolineae bacterium]|nr:winged helix-turn-helix domain-containing protein [Anaerolineae bacterium]